MDLVIAVDDPRAHDVRDLLAAHLRFARQVTPAEGVHALDVYALLDPAITFFSARADGELLAVAALKQLDRVHAEVKSMHTAPMARRNGVARTLVRHLLTVAADRGYRHVSLETGTMDEFEPARALYRSLGFRHCPPFGEYATSPTSYCMTIALETMAPSD